jgi:hypothetical protein
VRFRPHLLLLPVFLAGGLAFASPKAVLAANGMTETGTTTYEVAPSTAQIKVTVKMSIYNGKASVVDSGGVTYFYWNATEIGVEKEASAVAVTSDAGAVYQAPVSSGVYYRFIKLTYPNVYYGQTRVVTATYTIPAAPHAAGGFRAGQAYASLCAIGNGIDVGTVSIVLPNGYTFHSDDGGEMNPTDTANGKQTYTSGSLTAPYKFWTCMDAEQEASLLHTPVTASSQTFDIQAWPEDSAWGAEVKSDVSTDVPALEALTGLKMPGGTIHVLEAGDQQLGEYGGLYNSATSTAQIPETVRKDTVAHELSHIWFNRTLFLDKWMSEGLAGYSEQAAGAGNFTPCPEPSTYPGTGSPDLTTWQLLNTSSTTQQVQISDYQYAAACYIFTALAKDMGPANLALVLRAAYGDEIAYVGASPDEQLSGAKLPLTAEELLDLIDERGMVAGGEDLDTAQTLLAKYGIFDGATLAERSTARAAYHSLASAAGTWKLPLAIRAPMSKWQFSTAKTAMATAQQIIETRDSVQKLISGLSLDATVLRRQFEAAATQADLDDLLASIKKEADAAARVDEATKRSNDNRTILQSIGLLGTDVQTPLTQAKTDLSNVKPESATANAQAVIDSIAKSSDQGLLRAGAVAGVLAIILLLLALVVFLRRRRPSIVILGPGNGPSGPVLMIPPGGPEAWPGASSWQQPSPHWQQPPQPPAQQWPSGGWEQAVLPPDTFAPPAAQPPANPETASETPPADDEGISRP